ncbi:bifunctional nicotinamide-nucleotide adenylyltransferase/Nudix hydroxylase [Psychrobacter frigidicola]|uniref:Bifunctional nicotinamide-nucleotide adenylyltransferase/Nudix hydroxylase n=1 Tax=Psychrobacter frigidicola TaxID=45611 RepID=A0A5C7A2P0_9GAMM|nr:bifunctional nicotinamide-nucleotide adenylyltransferase/Nudix hydroxylase [Psychrobacter frigidicola]TXD96042.1 bifunctional nicotinamide-nucleotide adenylyltransferase/Nudix hydroxylase [Psychrobacter frigidicola]
MSELLEQEQVANPLEITVGLDNQANKHYHYLVFIGRFQPFHNGHKAVIEEALKRSNEVIILIGSANLPRSLRNPFSVAERTAMIKGAYSKEEAARIHCVALDDVLYNDTRWLQYVQAGVRSVTGDLRSDIGLIGHSKDSSSYYLSLFPHWASISVPSYHNLSATPIRDSYLMGATPTSERTPKSTRKILDNFKKTTEYQQLHEEAGFIDKYKKQWEAAPYPPTFMTADALVVQSGHILLVERRSMPGRGLWALPGGFVDAKETLFDACIRELREETRLKVPEPVLRGSRHSQHTFDDPYRSARGRTITQAFYFQLKNDAKGLPKVKGGDDAAQAFWLPLAELDSKMMFEDHYAIIMKMVGL